MKTALTSACENISVTRHLQHAVVEKSVKKHGVSGDCETTGDGKHFLLLGGKLRNPALQFVAQTALFRHRYNVFFVLFKTFAHPAGILQIVQHASVAEKYRFLRQIQNVFCGIFFIGTVAENAYFARCRLQFAQNKTANCGFSALQIAQNGVYAAFKTKSCSFQYVKTVVGVAKHDVVEAYHTSNSSNVRENAGRKLPIK